MPTLTSERPYSDFCTLQRLFMQMTKTAKEAVWKDGGCGVNLTWSFHVIRRVCSADNGYHIKRDDPCQQNIHNHELF
jgi:hypothetical protein